MSPMALPLIPPTTPDFSAQLQRIEILHQQLKLEAARAQDFLAKLKRGEEIHSQTQIQTHAKIPSPAPEDGNQVPAIKKKTHGDRVEADVRNGKHSDKGAMDGKHTTETDTVCCCQHHPVKPLTEKEKKVAGDYRKARLGPLGALPSLPTHVDEREVRDLEKRVRGLEGRVRGFEGLPPDREMALLEVERLRKELEGLARRREGLFGLIDEKTKGVGQNCIKDIGKTSGKATTKSNGKVNGRASGKG